MGIATLIMWSAALTVALMGPIFMRDSWFDLAVLSVLGIGAIYVCCLISFGMGIFAYIFKNRPL